MSELPTDLRTIAEEAIARLSVRDIDGFLAFVDPEVEFVPLLAGVEAGVYRGHEGVRRWFGDVEDAWKGYRPSVRGVEETTDSVAVIELVIRLRGRASAVELEANVFGVSIHDLESRQIRSWRFYETKDEARAAAASAAER